MCYTNAANEHSVSETIVITTNIIQQRNTSGSNPNDTSKKCGIKIQYLPDGVKKSNCVMYVDENTYPFHLHLLIVIQNHSKTTGDVNVNQYKTVPGT
jgi:hypothetical protein